MSDTNDQLILIGGLSGSGKSASLRNIKNQEKWYYVNTEAGKRLPFKSNFRELRLEDPMQIFEVFDHGAEDADCEGIIVDSLTFLMEMYESQYVLTATNTMKAWSEYNQFFKSILQDRVIKFGKPVIFIAHIADTYDEKTLETKTSVPVKGALKGTGIEAYFSTIVYSQKMPLVKLKDYKSDLLNISEEEEDLGFKYVFQTRVTKDTVNTRIRSPMGLFDKSQTFMDNDCQILLDHLNNYYRS